MEVGEALNFCFLLAGSGSDEEEEEDVEAMFGTIVLLNIVKCPRQRKGGGERKEDRRGVAWGRCSPHCLQGKAM